MSFEHAQITCFVGLGSNIDPEKNLRRAAALLRTEWPAIRFSSAYRSAARDHEEQEDFLNAVATCETVLSPKEVLGVLQEVERRLGKATPFQYGPRAIDLDLLLYDDVILPNKEGWLESEKQATKNEKLILPHGRMHSRRFVLEPLCELLNEQSVHPVLGISWKELLKKTKGQRCDKLALSV